MNREWVKGMPWWDVHYTVNKGTYWEYENRTDVQANSSGEAMKVVQEENPLVTVWAAYEK